MTLKNSFSKIQIGQFRSNPCQRWENRVLDFLSFSKLTSEDTFERAPNTWKTGKSKNGGVMSFKNQKKENKVPFECQSGKDSVKTELPQNHALIQSYLIVLKPYLYTALVIIIAFADPFSGLSSLLRWLMQFIR